MTNLHDNRRKTWAACIGAVSAQGLGSSLRPHCDIPTAETHMIAQRNREEAVNTQLALPISKLGVTADAETIQVHGTHRPDVLFQLRGLRVVIEGKFRDTPNAEKIVLDDARRRVRAGIAHIAAATVYPDGLRSAPTTKILRTLADAQLRYRIVTETFESKNWYEGNPSSLMEALRRAQESLTQDDIVESTAKALSAHLESIAKLWIGQPGACDRLSRLLGIGIPKKELPQASSDRRETAARVSALVLANAFIFQEQLALGDERIDTLRKLKKSNNLVEATSSIGIGFGRISTMCQFFSLANAFLKKSLRVGTQQKSSSRSSTKRTKFAPSRPPCVTTSWDGFTIGCSTTPSISARTTPRSRRQLYSSKSRST